jgi:SAM-dependent methyltransferase
MVLPSCRTVDFDEYYRQAHPSEDHDVSYRWHARNRIGVAYRFQLERALVAALGAIDRPLESCRVLEVGSGGGRRLRFFAEIGVPPANLTGVELLESRVDQSRAMNPRMEIIQRDASDGLPFDDGAFDLVTQFVALSSVLDHSARRRIVQEMVRCTAVGGWVLTYEIRRAQPGVIPDGIPERAAATLFPGVEWRYRTRLHCVALPKLVRWPVLAELAELLPGVLKTNYLWLGQRVH